MKKVENLKQFANKYAHFLVCFGLISFLFVLVFFNFALFTLYMVVFLCVYIFFFCFPFFSSLKKGFTFVFETFYSAFFFLCVLFLATFLWDFK